MLCQPFHYKAPFSEVYKLAVKIYSGLKCGMQDLHLEAAILIK